MVSISIGFALGFTLGLLLRLPADCRSFIIFYYLTGCRSNSHFDYNAFSNCRSYSIPTSANMLLSIPRMALRWLYIVMLFLLQLTQLSSQLSTKISTIKNLQISYIYNENRTTFATFSLVMMVFFELFYSEQFG